MTLGSTRELILAQIAAGLPARALAASTPIIFSRSWFQRLGREAQLLQAVRLGVAGDEVEQLAAVTAQRAVTRKQGEIGVNPRRLRVIVAGAEVAIGAQGLALAPHHHRQLGVGLPVDEAEHHVDARALQVASNHSQTDTPVEKYKEITGTSPSSPGGNNGTGLFIPTFGRRV
jgi:hypothetical protein